MCRNAGWKKNEQVLLLERNERIGGCMSTGEITVPGFHHDLMSTNPILFVTSPAYKLLEEDLRRHGLEFCHSNRPTSVSRLDAEAWSSQPIETRMQLHSMRFPKGMVISIFRICRV